MQQTSNPLFRGNTLPAYLDLADSLGDVGEADFFHSRYLDIPSTSGTLERPAKSHPAIVNIGARARRAFSRSPEHSRRFVDSLIQKFSPKSVVGRTSLNTILVPSASILQPAFGANIPNLPPVVQGHLVPINQPPLLPALPALPMATKLKYTKFYGRKQDSDDWMTEFLDTARTNAEDAPAELLRIFPGLMKEDAMHWYHNDLTPDPG